MLDALGDPAGGTVPGEVIFGAHIVHATDPWPVEKEAFGQGTGAAACDDGAK